MVLFRGLAGMGVGMLCAGAYATRFTSSTVYCKSRKAEEEDDGNSISDFINGMDKEDITSSDPAASEVSWMKTWGVPWITDWDSPGKRGLQKRSSKIKRQVILIRHGQYQNEKNREAGDSAKTLTPMGEKQAMVTGAYLWDLFKDAHSTAAIEGKVAEPKFFYVSDMTRAQQTAKIILKSFPKKFRSRLTTDPILREKFPCDPQPAYPKRANQADALACEEAFAKYIHRPISDEHTCDIIICHANIIRYLLCRSLQIPPEAWLRFSLPHCSLTSIVISGNGNVKVSYVGSAFHLEPSLQSTRNL